MAADPKKLLADAIKAEEALESLATGLASAGADGPIVKTVEQMAKMTRKVVEVVGKQGAAEVSGERPEGEPGEEPAPEEAAPPPEEAPQPAPEDQPPAPSSARPSIASATSELQAEVQRRKAPSA